MGVMLKTRALTWASSLLAEYLFDAPSFRLRPFPDSHPLPPSPRVLTHLGVAQANDGYGNERGVGGDVFSVRVFPPGTRTTEDCRMGCSAQGRPQQAVVVDNTDSTYSVEYTQYDTGNHTVFSELLVLGGVQATYYAAPNITVPVSARAASAPGGSSLSLVGWQSPSLTAGLPGACFSANSYSVRWVGFVSPTQDSTYTFQFQRSQSISGDRMRLWVDNSLVVDQWASLASAAPSGTIALQAFAFYDLWADYQVQTTTIIPHSAVVRRRHPSSLPAADMPQTSRGRIDYLSTDSTPAPQLAWNAGLSSVDVVPSMNLYAGYPVQGSPFPVLVLPALTCASLSIATPNQVSGGSLELATAGMQAEFTITSKDQYGNLRMAGGDLYRVRFTGTEAVGGVVQVRPLRRASL